jgi:O-antigen biosynthesis protein WbqL
LYGFVEIFPETLAWDEQLALFAQAKFIIGDFGSALHNTVFTPAQTKVLVILAQPYNFIQSGIATLNQHQLAYISPDLQKAVEMGSHYTLDKNHLKTTLEFMLQI